MVVIFLLCVCLSYLCLFLFFFFFFFKQKTAYEMRISDWSSDVCSSDLLCHRWIGLVERLRLERLPRCAALLLALTLGLSDIAQAQELPLWEEIGRATCRERVCQYV